MVDRGQASKMPFAAELRIRTDSAQMDDVVTQIAKVFEMTSVAAETADNERLYTITPRKPPQKLPPINVVFFAADDTSPVSPHKLRSLICNPAYVGLEPYIASLVDDELWIAAAALLVRREGVEQFLVNMLYTLQTTLGVEGEDRSTTDVPSPESIPPYPEEDIDIERPVALRVSSDKDSLKRIIRLLELVLILYEQKTTGKSGTKHFAAKLTQVDKDLPTVSAKYMSPKQIFAHPPGFTDEFLDIATDPNVMWSLFGNPMYTGIADFNRLSSDEGWLRAASLLMREAGIEQYLVNMLYLMRRSIRDWLRTQ